MSAAAAAQPAWPPATAGELAVANFESVLESSWRMLQRWPERPGTVARIVEDERLRAQFLGDSTALDRLTALVAQRSDVHAESVEAQLVAAQVASMRHHFADAGAHLTRAIAAGASSEVTTRLRLTIDQATGENVDAVLAGRHALANASGSLPDLVALGALLADLGEYELANQSYCAAIRQYRDVSPFALAWACFQQGLLWGETVPAPDPKRAAYWYQQALAYLPAYSLARIHLAEIRLDSGELESARVLLLPVAEGGDPEAAWRLAQVSSAAGDVAGARQHLAAARRGFDALLGRHKLAFADHAAEFLLAEGADPVRAFDLARANLANRSTLRAFVLAYEAAEAVGNLGAAHGIATHAQSRWGRTPAFAASPLAEAAIFPPARQNSETH